jgi:hypothetical protein
VGGWGWQQRAAAAGAAGAGGLVTAAGACTAVHPTLYQWQPATTRLPACCLLRPYPTLPAPQMQKLQQSISGRQPAGAATSPGTASYASSKLYKS